MEPPNVSIGTHPERGQGSGTPIEDSMEVGIKGLGYFGRGAPRGE